MSLANLVVIKRPGYSWKQFNRIDDNVIFVEGPIVDISGTEIRARVAEGNLLKAMLPKSVEDYIYQNNLYSNKEHYG